MNGSHEYPIETPGIGALRDTDRGTHHVLIRTFRLRLAPSERWEPDKELFAGYVNIALRVRDVVLSGAIGIHDDEIGDLLLLDASGQYVSLKASIGLYRELRVYSKRDIYPTLDDFRWSKADIVFGRRMLDAPAVLEPLRHALMYAGADVQLHEMPDPRSSKRRATHERSVGPDTLVVVHSSDLLEFEEIAGHGPEVDLLCAAAGIRCDAQTRPHAVVLCPAEQCLSFVYEGPQFELKEHGLSSLLEQGRLLRLLCGDPLVAPTRELRIANHLLRELQPRMVMV